MNGYDLASLLLLLSPIALLIKVKVRTGHTFIKLLGLNPAKNIASEKLTLVEYLIIIFGFIAPILYIFLSHDL